MNDYNNKSLVGLYNDSLILKVARTKHFQLIKLCKKARY